MYPFPATLDGKPVMVYDICQMQNTIECAIVHPDGKPGWADWYKLNVSQQAPNLLDTLRAERDAAIARAESAEKAQADLQTQLDEIERSDRDLLDESIEVAQTLEIDTGGDYDLLVRAREVMAELRDLRAKVRG